MHRARADDAAREGIGTRAVAPILSTQALESSPTARDEVPTTAGYAGAITGSDLQLGKVFDNSAPWVGPIAQVVHGGSSCLTNILMRVFQQRYEHGDRLGRTEVVERIDSRLTHDVITIAKALQQRRVRRLRLRSGQLVQDTGPNER